MSATHAPHLCVCARERPGVVSWGWLIFSDLERSSTCPLPAFFSLCPLLCTLTHTSPAVNHSLFTRSLDLLAFLFINWFLLITHACPKAHPSAFCQANPWICVCELCVYLTFPVGRVAMQSWMDLMCCHSAMLTSMVMTLGCSCHATLNDASMIQLSLEI